MDDYRQEIRFLITQRCNYNCYFCHKEGLLSYKEDLLTPEDIRRIFVVGRDNFGIRSATLTGGEPLVREDITKIASILSEEHCEVTVTTNGSLLSRHLDIGNFIVCANVSIHTLRKDKYEKIVQRSHSFEQLLDSLYLFRCKFPSVGICLNTAVVEGINADKQSVLELINYARSIKSSIKFIELYPKNVAGYVPIEQIKQFLLDEGFHIIPSCTRKERFFDGNVEVGLIKILCSAAADSFNPSDYCKIHNDLFISPDGTIKPCRAKGTEIPLLSFVKENDYAGIYSKLKLAFEMLGTECPLSNKVK